MPKSAQAFSTETRWLVFLTDLMVDLTSKVLMDPTLITKISLLDQKFSSLHDETDRASVGHDNLIFTLMFNSWPY
ncbi:hypothetical protein G6F49_006774 [Rhizopus delemar]|nr:hypothetical protein G6F49_006774 [Rhizopus delemar]KAG1586017.1 hypothetical protein G6F48_006874 [Rhizopus delemar]